MKLGTFSFEEKGSVTIFDGVDLPHGSLLLEVLVDLLAEQVVLVSDPIPGVAHPLSHVA